MHLCIVSIDEQPSVTTALMESAATVASTAAS